MPIHEIMKLSKEAAQRARAAIAAEKAKGGPGWGKRGLAAAAGPLAEIGDHSRAVQRFRKIEEGLNDKQHRLHVVRLDSTRPPDVKRREVAELETGIEDLKTARRDWEEEVRTTLLPALPRMKPEPPVEERTPPRGLPALPRMKPTPPAEDRTPPLPRMEPPSPIEDRTPPLPQSKPKSPADDNRPPVPTGPGGADDRPVRAVTNAAPRQTGPDGNTVKGRAVNPATGAEPPNDWFDSLPVVPLTTDGAVDKDALRPKQVYRIPESAGGGLGRWTNGMFFNFDRKADWNIRSAADLDAFSGASDEPTPDERWERDIAWLKSGGAAMPAVFLEQPDIDKFNSQNEEKVRAVQGDDAVSFSLGEGPAFLTLPDDAAAVLVRNWDDFRPRLRLLSRLFAEDLSPGEMRRLIEAEVYKSIPESERAKPSAMAPDGTMYAFDDPFGGERFIAKLRMRVFDEMVEGIRSGATEEEIAELIGEFQQIMLPELMGAGRFLGELAKDLVPGLNNVRSGVHFWNDLIEIEEEWKEGDITGLAGNSLMLVLDGLGMIPIVGSAFAPVRSGLKKGARAVGKALPRLDALVAQAQVWKHKLQWPNLEYKVDPLRIFGPTVKNLSDDVVEALGRKANWIVGDAAAGYLRGLLRRMDPAARLEVRIANADIVPGATKGRRYDMAARDATAILVEDIAGWMGRRFGRQWDDFRARWDHYEFKGGAGKKKRSQEPIDKYANEHPGRLLEEGGVPVTKVRDIRIFPQQIPIEYAIADAERRLGQLVNRGVIDEATSVALLNGMIAESKRGTKLVGLFDYTGMFVNLLAAGGHRIRAATAGDSTKQGRN